MSSTQPSGVPDDADNQAESPTPTEIWEAMARGMSVLRRNSERLMRHIDPAARERSLSVPRLRLLGELAFHGPLRMSDLAYEMGVTPRTITTMVDSLEREDMVVRRPDTDDRRAIIVSLSERAKATDIGQFGEAQREAFAKLLAPLDPEERRQLYQILNKLSAAWENFEETSDDRRRLYRIVGRNDDNVDGQPDSNPGETDFHGRHRARRDRHRGGERGPSGGGQAGRRSRPNRGRQRFSQE